VAEATDIDIEDLIVEEDMVITVSRGGYIKRSPLSLYRAQRRGGKGRIGATTKEEDLVEHLFVASTHAYVLAFTSRGRMHWIKVYDIPQLGPATRGKAIVNLLSLSPNERHGRDGRDEGLPRGPLPDLRDEERSREEDCAFGVLERAFRRHHRDQPRRGRFAALGAITGGEDQIFIGTRQGMGIRFSEKDVRPWAATPPASSALRSRRTTTKSSRWTSSTRRRTAFGHGERLRQALRSGRVPLPGPRRLGRHQRQVTEKNGPSSASSR
jgi:DNA gyrase subunit A